MGAWWRTPGIRCRPKSFRCPSAVGQHRGWRDNVLHFWNANREVGGDLPQENDFSFHLFPPLRQPGNPKHHSIAHFNGNAPESLANDFQIVTARHLSRRQQLRNAFPVNIRRGDHIKPRVLLPATGSHPSRR